MSPRKAESGRDLLLQAGTLCFRREGYVATTVDAICREAGVSKGSFFHHFASKEALAAACLAKWGGDMAAMDSTAAYRSMEDPVDRLMGCMDFYAAMFADANQLKSCLAGTIAQEIFDSHPTLRDACNQCFVGVEAGFVELIRDAIADTGIDVDATALARLWTGTIQGSLILYKASQDASVIKSNLMHVRAYIGSLVVASD